MRIKRQKSKRDEVRALHNIHVNSRRNLFQLIPYFNESFKTHIYLLFTPEIFSLVHMNRLLLHHCEKKEAERKRDSIDQISRQSSCDKIISEFQIGMKTSHTSVARYNNQQDDDDFVHQISIVFERKRERRKFFVLFSSSLIIIECTIIDLSMV